MFSLIRISAFALALGTALPGAAGGESATFHVVSERTRAGFAVTYLGFATQYGHFAHTSGTIVLDRERKVGTIDLVIDARSVQTGWDLRDAFLRGETMFDADRFPTLHFRSTRLLFDDGRLVAVEGEITLHGVTQPLRLEVTRLQCAPTASQERESCEARVIGRISRRAFGMDFAYPLIGDDVDLDIALDAVSTSRATAMR
jgi:polyisoprenoid-binding protein YceI